MATGIEIYIDAKEFSEMKIISINQAEEYKKSFKHYIQEIVDVIIELQKQDVLCYNRTVVEKCEHLKISDDLLSHYTYTAQSYLRNKNAFDKIENYKKEFSDWEAPTNENIKNLIDSKKFVMVTGLGKEPFKARPFIDAENKLYWIKPRFKRSGYRLEMTKFKHI